MVIYTNYIAFGDLFSHVYKVVDDIIKITFVHISPGGTIDFRCLGGGHGGLWKHLAGVLQGAPARDGQKHGIR